MKRVRDSGRRSLLLPLIACALVGAWAIGIVRGVFDLAEVARLVRDKKTVCVGRFLIDVPKLFHVAFSGERIDGFAIDTFEETAEEFRERIRTRESSIGVADATLHAKHVDGMVEARDLRIPGMEGRTFVHGLTRSYGIEDGKRVDTEWVSVEAYGHIGNVSFVLSSDVADKADARWAEGLLARLRQRREEGIPQSSGFCTARAVFVDDLPPYKKEVYQYEHTAIYLGLPGHPDMRLSFTSMPGSDDRDGLLARVNHNDADITFLEMLQVSKLRARERKINGIRGDEVLERVRELNFTAGHSFMWESQGAKNDQSRPFLLLELDAGTNPRAGGKPVNSSLNDDALLALWDDISSSIRIRQP